MDLFAAAAERIGNSSRLAEDFQAICALGGRFAGTPSERNARDFLATRLAEVTRSNVQRAPVPYLGWDRGPARVTTRHGRVLPATSLGRSPATGSGGLAAEVVDLGRGSVADFTRERERIRGRIVLVRHEYMLGESHIHRRRKYEMSKQAGAAGFLIAFHLPGELLVTGSAGTGSDTDIPAAGVSYETGQALADEKGLVVLVIEGRFDSRVAENLVAEIPGKSNEFIVMCAHIDGHDLAVSAIDNASGLACVLAIAEALQDEVPKLRRGVRVILFNVEEWAMIGSRHYLAALAPRELRSISFNLNLDSVAGSAHLGVMTSGIQSSGQIVAAANAAHALGLGVHNRFMGNSDHGNFIQAGVPAVRLCAGFDDSQSNLRFLLTPADTPDKVRPQELTRAATAGAALLLAASECELVGLEPDEIARITAA